MLTICNIIDRIPKRSTLSDANARRSEKFFEEVYHNLYETNKEKLTSDSRRNGTEEWIKRLRTIDSTTIHSSLTPFSKVWDAIPKQAERKEV